MLLSIFDIGDHPCVCGEKRTLFFILLTILGSPLRVRGKERKIEAQRMREGITPACAGKSKMDTFRISGAWDHPRMCREKLIPLVRLISLPGITPACAGKSMIHCDFQQISRDHPRMCGEKPATFPATRPSEGSPPHVRGKVRKSPRQQIEIGITPACAGKKSV